MIRLLILLSAILLSACSTQPKNSTAAKNNATTNAATQSNVGAKKKNNGYARAEKHNSESLEMDEDALLFYLLRKEFFNWQGTPYRLGGSSKRGIDCSALVQHIYRDSLNIKLPRTTETQVKEGYLVYRNQLKIGDLVFFKTGWRTRHVGIYIGNDDFIHASTSKGVITSSLNNVYWKPKYWQAKRIID